MRSLLVIFISLAFIVESSAQFILYGYDSKSLHSGSTLVMLNESDSINYQAILRAREDWKLTSGLTLMNPAKPGTMKVSEGNTAIVPMVENFGPNPSNYRLAFVVAGKNFSALGETPEGFYTRIADGEIIASLVIDKELLHTVHVSNFLLALGTLAKASAFLKSDADKDAKWKRNYYFEGIVDVIFEPSHLDILVNDKFKVQQQMYQGKVMDEPMRNSPDLFVKNTRGFAYIVTEYRKDMEPMIHRYYVVPGRGLVYLESNPESKHPVHKFTRDDLFIYGKAQREGRH